MFKRLIFAVLVRRSLGAVGCGLLFAAGLSASDGGMQQHWQQQQVGRPTWPLAGTDADVQVFPNAAERRARGDENIRIISQIGADGAAMHIQNNINLTSSHGADSFSGGANLTHPQQAPPGFNPFIGQADMSFMLTEMPENDGARALAVSQSNRQPPVDRARFAANAHHGGNQAFTGVAIDDIEPDIEVRDQVRSWVVASGQNLRDVLQQWADREGWDLIWNTPREYPIAASAVFKGRFIDVSSALVRNFSRATPVPHAKFYKGNRVLVISTIDNN